MDGRLVSVAAIASPPFGRFLPLPGISHSMDLIYKIVRRLRRDDDVNFSRNKNFDAYDDPTVQQAVRLHHHLASVEQDLRSLVPANRVTLEAVEREGGRQLKLHFQEVDGQRISYLNPKDWVLLREDAELRPLLETLFREADSDDREAIREAIEILGEDDVR